MPGSTEAFVGASICRKAARREARALDLWDARARYTALGRRLPVASWRPNMRMRTILVLIVLIAIAVFLWINWPAITAVARFSLLVTTFEAPVGLVMLTLLGVIVATFVAY